MPLIMIGIVQVPAHVAVLVLPWVFISTEAVLAQLVRHPLIAVAVVQRVINLFQCPHCLIKQLLAEPVQQLREHLQHIPRLRAMQLHMRGIVPVPVLAVVLVPP